jgi:hypothetical protein
VRNQYGDAGNSFARAATYFKQSGAFIEAFDQAVKFQSLKVLDFELLAGLDGTDDHALIPSYQGKAACQYLRMAESLDSFSSGRKPAPIIESINLYRGEAAERYKRASSRYEEVAQLYFNSKVISDIAKAKICLKYAEKFSGQAQRQYSKLGNSELEKTCLEDKIRIQQKIN